MKNRILLLLFSVFISFLSVQAQSTTELQKIIANDGESYHFFGQSASISGDNAIVGAAYDDDSGYESGSAYIFHINSSTWYQQVKLFSSDIATEDRFGCSVSISGDYAIVGAAYDDDNGSSSGSAYIFYKDEGGTDNWGQQAKLTASDGAGNDFFGRSVSISGDYAIVGAEGDDDNGSSSGSAYIFYKDEGGTDNWGQKTKLTASDGTSEDYFGQSVNISGDYAIVGADGDDSYTGSAYIFYKDEGGPHNWGQQAKLTASDNITGDFFGCSVSISDEYAIVGAHSDDDSGYESGSAYIFYKDEGGNDNWGQKTKLTASDGQVEDFFGSNVRVSENYAIVTAGSDDDNGSNSGSAYVFYKDEGGTDNWGQKTKLTASDGASGDFFGLSLGISDGTAIIGAFKDDDNGTQSGSAYIFDVLAPIPNVIPLPDITGECFAAVDYLPTATDNYAGTVYGATSDPLIYTEQGTYTITWEYNDGNGNIETQEQTVIVDDITNPTITCVDDQTIDLAQGQTTYTVQGTEFDANADDNCEVETLENNYNNTETLDGEEFAPGTYTITWTTTDIGGNTNECIFVLTVNEFVNTNDLAQTNISIYPNPSNGIFNVKTDNNYDITISDISGKTIFTDKCQGNSKKTIINLSSQASGIYLIKFTNENKTVNAKLIIE